MTEAQLMKYRHIVQKRMVELEDLIKYYEGIQYTNREKLRFILDTLKLNKTLYEIFKNWIY